MSLLDRLYAGANDNLAPGNALFREAAAEIERLTREGDALRAMLTALTEDFNKACDQYDESVAYAELLAAELRFQRENLPARQWPRIDAALAKNPNPIGTLNLSIDKQGREAENPSSGPVGLGPECIYRTGCKNVHRCTVEGYCMARTEGTPAQGNSSTRARPECPMGSQPCGNPACAEFCNLIDREEWEQMKTNPEIKAKCTTCKKVFTMTPQAIIEAKRDGCPFSPCCFAPATVERVTAKVTPEGGNSR